MVELSCDKLSKSYLNLIAVRNILNYVQNETYKRTDDKFLNAIEFPYVGKLSKNRKQFIGEKMDLMNQSIEELVVLGLVSDFEKIVFDKVENASGEISKIVKNHYKASPFNKFSTNFVKSEKDIDKLSIIKAIISPKLPNELANRFSDIIEFRNRLAHGKRFGKQSTLSFDEIAQILDDILNYIL